MFLDSITFHKDKIFDYKRENQKNFFKIKSRTYKEKNLRKPIYDEKVSRYRPVGYEIETITEEIFTIFKKDLSIKFNHNLTVIVGDNGCGKTSLINELTPPKKEQFYFSLNGKSKEKFEKDKIKNWLSNDIRTLTYIAQPNYYIVGKDLHKLEIIQQAKDDLREAIDKPTKPKQGAEALLSMWDKQTFSNGENNLDFINSLQGITNGLIILDEPETSLSIKSVKKLCKIIEQLSENNQLIVITHNEHIMRLINEVYDFENKRYINANDHIKQQNC